ncbi:HCNGP-like protein-domain-containing protein [Xylaria sp. FL0064]|nr:HCNGP-like protein-domain-containing protein [Xylaria sp. FL0064]
MAGLVAYESSDEEDEVKPHPAQPAPEPLRRTEEAKADTNSIPNTTTKEAPKSPQPKPKVDEAQAVYGPQIGPSSGPSFPPLEEDPAAVEIPLPPGSPYTATRALLRDLTLPAVPDMDIPPSPPGSPSAATSKKFENFLELKKKGVHFNARLADNSSMKNPVLADKLMAFVELDHRDQYRTTLPVDLWDPEAFPRYAYKEQLRQSQSECAQARARAAGAPVKFVAAEAAASSSANVEDGKTAQASTTGRRKTRFDT